MKIQELLGLLNGKRVTIMEWNAAACEVEVTHGTVRKTRKMVNESECEWFALDVDDSDESLSFPVDKVTSVSVQSEFVMICMEPIK